MTLRLVIDGRPLVGERTGIGVHTAEIASRLGEDLAPLLASHAPISDLTGIEELERRVDRRSPGVLWQQMTLPRVAIEENADVVWGPHGTLPLRLARPAVVTLHDLTSITMPHAHRMKTILSFNPLIHRSLEKAVKIISVSRFSADAAIRGFGIDPQRLEVIPNGVSEFFSPGESVSTDETNILYVGAFEPRKGIGDLISAWERLPRRPKLILAGSKGWKNDALRRRIRSRVDEGEIVVTGYIDRERLRQLYREATVFVYPSHFEGFGLPVLEAMACGTPVITTTGGALPEAAGDAALLVEPHDREALSRAIDALLTSSERRREMIDRGLEHVKQFSWAGAARHASAVFRYASEHGR